MPKALELSSLAPSLSCVFLIKQLKYYSVAGKTGPEGFGFKCADGSSIVYAPLHKDGLEAILGIPNCMLLFALYKDNYHFRLCHEAATRKSNPGLIQIKRKERIEQGTEKGVPW